MGEKKTTFEQTNMKKPELEVRASAANKAILHADAKALAAGIKTLLAKDDAE